jgi:hypothetical protein
LAIEFLTGVFPLPGEAGAALRAGLEGVGGTAASAPVPGASDFFKDVIPDNVVAAAADGAILPLVIFALFFALAASRIDAAKRAIVVGFFDAIADVLLVIIGWVLWIAPAGVFALAFTVGAGAGGAAFAALGHYVLLISIVGVLVTLAAYPLAILGGRIPAGAFARCMIGPQTVAISTRSSLACLPAMLTAARGMRIREETAGVSLPIAVALFRATGPAMNTAVAFYVAHWMGLEPTLTQMVAATAVGAVMSYGAISLPGEVSFISSIAPVAIALGVPVARESRDEVPADDRRTVQPHKQLWVQSFFQRSHAVVDKPASAPDVQAHIIAFSRDPVHVARSNPDQPGEVGGPELLQPAGRRFDTGLGPCAKIGPRPVDAPLKPRRIHRFHQVVHGFHFESGNRKLVEGRDEHDGRRALLSGERAGHRDAVHARHGNVEQQQVGL